jgi:hypothetical protein
MTSDLVTTTASDRWLAEWAVGRGTGSWIVRDGLRESAKPLIPPSRVRSQGSGTQDTPDENLFTVGSYVLVSGCARRTSPPRFGVSRRLRPLRFACAGRTCHRSGRVRPENREDR